MNMKNTQKRSRWRDFWSGFSSAFAFDGDIFPVEDAPTDPREDIRNLRRDWANVASDFTTATNKVLGERQTKQPGRGRQSA